MPSAQPICAARIVRSQFMNCGWGAVLSKEKNDAIADIKDEANAMYQMQLSHMIVDQMPAAGTLNSNILVKCLKFSTCPISPGDSA